MLRMELRPGPRSFIVAEPSPWCVRKRARATALLVEPFKPGARTGVDACITRKNEAPGLRARVAGRGRSSGSLAARSAAGEAEDGCGGRAQDLQIEPEA